MCKQVIYLVDDDAWSRQSVQRLLRASGYEVQAFASATAFLEAYDGQGAGCVVLDLRLSGLEVLARLKAAESPLAVVLVSGRHDVASAVAAIKAGAFDFLLKPLDPSALQAVVATALRESAARWVAHEKQMALRHRFATLTPREREVCQLVAAGYLNKQAAYELGTAEKTIKVHRARVMTKLQVGSVAELVRFVDYLAPAASPGLPAPATARAEIAS